MERLTALIKQQRSGGKEEATQKRRHAAGNAGALYGTGTLRDRFQNLDYVR